MKKLGQAFVLMHVVVVGQNALAVDTGLAMSANGNHVTRRRHTSAEHLAAACANFSIGRVRGGIAEGLSNDASTNDAEKYVWTDEEYGIWLQGKVSTCGKVLV